jgi:hypothetical protein
MARICHMIQYSIEFSASYTAVGSKQVLNRGSFVSVAYYLSFDMKPAVIPEVCRGSPQFLDANAGMLLKSNELNFET